MTVRGTVTARGQGVEGATVLVAEHSLDEGALRRRGETPRPLIARTGKDGTWSVAEVPAGTYRITATAPGFTPSGIDGFAIARSGSPDDENARDDDRTAEIPAPDITLATTGFPVLGQITGPGGVPVTDAVIAVSTEINLPGEWALCATTSGKDGVYRIDLHPGQYILEAIHDDHVRHLQPIEVGYGAMAHDIRLQPAATIEGRVVTADGVPVSDALVTARNDRFSIIGDDPAVSGNGPGAAATDDDGRFVLRQVKPGLVHLRAIHHHTASRQPTVVEVAVGEKKSGVEVVVQPAFIVSGQVVHQRRRTIGIGDRFIGLRDVDRDLTIGNIYPSSADGRFVVWGVPPGRYEVSEFGRALTGPPLHYEEPPPIIDVTEGNVSDVIVAVEPRREGVFIKARVDPPKSAYLRVDTTAENPLSLMASMPGHLHGVLRTNPRGQLSIKPIPLGQYELRAETADGWVGTRTIDVIASRSTEIIIEMEERAVVSGSIRSGPAGGNGEGVAGTVRLGRWIAHEAFPDDPSMAKLESFFAETGPDGEFRIPGVSAGTYLLTVQQSRGSMLPWSGMRGQERWQGREVTIARKGAATGKESGKATGGELVGGDLGDLFVDTPGEALHGQILGPDGTPRIGVRVVASRKPLQVSGPQKVWAGSNDTGGPASMDDQDGEDGEGSEDGGYEIWFPPAQPAYTDREGRFTITGLYPGPHDLEVEDPATGSSITTVATVNEGAVGEPVTVTLEPPGQVHGVITLAGAAHAGGLTIEVTGPTATRRWLENSDGRFAIGRLAPGEYSIAASCDHGTAVASFSLNRGESKELTFAVDPWATVSGTVIDSATRQPVPDATVGLSSHQGRFHGLSRMSRRMIGEAVTGPDGRFRFERVLPGPRTLRVHNLAGWGDSFLEREITVEVGQDLDLGGLEGTQVDPE